MRITAFKTPKPRRFEYTPRFYDPIKEMRQEREQRALRELENESKSGSGEYIPMSKSDAKHYISFGRAIDRKGTKGGVLIRIFTIVLALTVALLIFYGSWVLLKLS